MSFLETAIDVKNDGSRVFDKSKRGGTDSEWGVRRNRQSALEATRSTLTKSELRLRFLSNI